MTPEVIHGIETLSILFLIVWNILLEIRLGDAVADLTEQRQETSKLRIQAYTKILSDPELDALLSRNLDGPTTIRKKN